VNTYRVGRRGFTDGSVPSSLYRGLAEKLGCPSTVILVRQSRKSHDASRGRIKVEAGLVVLPGEYNESQSSTGGVNRKAVIGKRGLETGTC